jgi:hypothetical protein
MDAESRLSYAQGARKPAGGLAGQRTRRPVGEEGELLGKPLEVCSVPEIIMLGNRPCPTHVEASIACAKQTQNNGLDHYRTDTDKYP